MPPRKSAATTPDPAQVLVEARKALLPALADSSPKPLNNFFVSAKVAGELGSKCVEQKWLEPTGEKSGSGKTAKQLFRLTAEGTRAALSVIGRPGIEEVRSMLDRLEQTLEGVRSAIHSLRAGLAEPAAGPPPMAVVTPPVAPTTPGRDDLRRLLHEQYDYLAPMAPARDGMVKIPRLFDRVARFRPDLGLEPFHAELQSLWDDKLIELHILNEVHAVPDANLGIRRGGAVYYYIYWKKPK